jgi:predicted nucleotide-binding protein
VEIDNKGASVMSTPMPMPNLFIGSSRESIKYGLAIHNQLRRVSRVTPWFTGTFGANDYTMEALERRLDKSDFGVFVFSPDDVAFIRGKHVFITRDNTIFEMGLFWGKLRRNRVFCIVPREIASRDDLIEGVNIKDFHLLSDLAGLTILDYDFVHDGEYDSAVSVACGKISEIIAKEQFYLDSTAELKSKNSVLKLFWEYNRNVTVIEEADKSKKYHSLSEAIRIAFLPPPIADYSVTHVALWAKAGSDGMTHVGGNIGQGEFFPFKSEDDPNAEVPIVIDVYNSGKWAFYYEQHVARVCVLCYPLGKNHVVSVHLSGNTTLTKTHLQEVVHQNDDLLLTIKHLVGGDSK